MIRRPAARAPALHRPAAAAVSAHLRGRRGRAAAEEEEEEEEEEAEETTKEDETFERYRGGEVVVASKAKPGGFAKGD